MSRYEFSYVPLRGVFFPVIPFLIRTTTSDWIGSNGLLDSGASISLLHADIARALGIRVKEGGRVRPSGIKGRVTAYTHSVFLKIGEDEFLAEVAFTDELKVQMNLLGRRSIFEKYDVTFIERGKKTVLETPDQ